LLATDKSFQANEIIDEAEQQGVIDREKADRLHNLRMCRNGLQHPESRQIPYNKATLEEWKEIVFSIKEN
jgi:uncharacterized protein YutE (UPF0331/DUF86 family)